MQKYNILLEGRARSASLFPAMAGLFFILLVAQPALARDVSFTWSANPENVDGYRLYYKTGVSGPPYDGTGTVEGPSPVETGNVTTFTLHGLSDTETYYFALTAYLGAEESAYSAEIMLPPATPSQTGRTISFAWSPNPETVDGYKLYYEDIPLGGTCPLPTEQPFNSVDAAEGPSPVNTGNVTTYTLQGLAVDKNYCFALTAYLGDVESAYTQPIQLDGDNPPVASLALVSTSENKSVSGILPASDPDGDSLTYSIVQNPTLGTADITNPSAGAYTYTPDPGASGSDSFTFKVNDGILDSNTATVTVKITAVNEAPVAAIGSISTDEDVPANGTLSATDPDGDTLTYTIISPGVKGKAVITNAATGAFVYTPNQDANGSDTFTFKVNDGALDSNVASVAVTIAAVNDAPVASDLTIATDEDTAAAGQLSATDPDGDTLTYSIVANGSSGTVNISNPATGSFTYTPNPDATGSDSFTYKVNDGSLDSNAASVTVTIKGVNDAPAASDLSIATDEDTAATGQLSATDPDGDTLTYSIVANGSSGIANITNKVSGTFTYTPNPDVNGSDSFTYRVNDGTTNSNTATVTVSIAQVNDPPVAKGASITTDEDTSVSGQLSATDPEGDSLTFRIATAPAKGSTTITNAATGAFTYTPDPDATGSDSFTFLVSDGKADSDPASIAVTINPVNDLPTADPLTLETVEDTAVSGQLSGSDPDGDALNYKVVAQPRQGNVVLTDPATGEFIFTPSPNTNGEDTFTYVVNDGTGDSAEATVAITVAAVNDPPVVADLSISAEYNTAYQGRLFAGDVDGDALTYQIRGNGSSGTAVLTDPVAGTFTYTPNQDATGSDSFTFTVSDGTVSSAEATVTVTLFDALTKTAVFGDTPESGFPGTIQDTYIEPNTRTNAGSEILKIYSSSASAPHKVADTILVKADLAGIPASATVIEARLFLYQTNATGEVAYNSTIHKIIGKNPLISETTGYDAAAGEPWSPVPEGTTANNVPLGLADIGPAEDNVVLFGQEGYRSWVITQMVQDWINDPASNTGLLLQGVVAPIVSGRDFGATENQNGSIRPKLVVRYRLIPPPPKLIIIEEIK